jgi:hypothetical protein
MRPSIRFLTCIVCSHGIALAACGPEDPEQPPVDDTPLVTLEDLEPPAPEPVALESASGCALDADCAQGTYCFQGLCALECAGDAECASGEACDASRGRCVVPSASGLLGALGDTEGARPDALPALSPTNSPQTVFDVGAGQASVDFTLELSGDAPAEGISYRLTRSDADAPDGLVRRTAGGSSTVTIPIEAGLADPDAPDPSTVIVQVESAVGSWSVALVPRAPVSGTYAGRVNVPGFGAQGVPIEFQLIAAPEGASLDDATSVKMRLQTVDWNLFSPVRGEGSPEWVTVEATRDDFTDSWVASFVGRYDMTDGVVQTAGPDQIRREMRFQLQQDGDDVTAQVRDRFEGLYESVTRQGVVNLEDVVFNGTLLAERSVAAADAPATADLPSADPQPLPPPSIEQCDDAMFSVAPLPYGDGAQAWDCDAIASAADFTAADPGERASCALAIAGTALSSSATTANQIKTYLEGGTIDGESFADFMARCATGADGLCRPTPETLCGRQATALAYRDIPGDDGRAEALIDSYAAATREAFLGRQLAAFFTDSDTRLTWLQSQDFPAVVTAEVRDLNEQLLEEWRANVLEVHLGVLSGQFDAAGLTVLAREPSTDEARAARQSLLFDMAQALRGALDATTLAARRWHTLLQDSRDREEKARFVARTARDLYVLAGVFSRLSLTSGGGEQGAVIATGFAELQRASLELSRDFDALLYARDAEVSVSTSLDPTRGNATLLADLEAAALDELTDAQDSVTRVLERAQAEALTETQLRDRMNNELADLRSDLVTLCGLPTDCTPDDLRNGEPECAVDVSVCGARVPRGQRDVLNLPRAGATASEGGKAILAVRDAGLEVRIANDELRAQLKRIRLYERNTAQFARNIRTRQGIRRNELQAIRDNIAAQDVWRRAGFAELAATLDEAASVRQDRIDAAQATLDDWDAIKIQQVDEKMGNLIASAIARQSAATLRDAAGGLKDFSEAAVAGFPTAGDDVTSTARMISLMGSAGFVLMMRASATAADWAATSLDLVQQRKDLITEADTKSTNLSTVVEALTAEDTFADLRARAERAQAEGDLEARNLANMLTLLRAQAEHRIAYLRDVSDLNDRRAELRSQLLLVSGLELRVAQAKLGVQQRILDWLSIQQRARLVEAKLVDLERQRADVAALVGSPAVLFSRANRLEQAERRLEDAKDAMMDWLVALEYFAVRPFIDQRIQILLARNTYQLEEVADRLSQIQNDCGGAVNTFTAELSLRDDLLGFTTPTQSPDGALVFSPAERLRAVMTSGFVPVSRRVRYRADSSVGDLMTRREDILSATFDVSLDDFANLQNTCNAKLDSLEVKLVGEGLGEANPTVTILYDGVGQLTSCQPDLDAYVSQFARASSFGQTTYLRSAGRSISPVAGVNAFPTDGSNETLNGLPLASQYTVLIDTSAGENGEIDWSRLEDVELKVAYTYQDVFPVGQCE